MGFYKNVSSFSHASSRDTHREKPTFQVQVGDITKSRKRKRERFLVFLHQGHACTLLIRAHARYTFLFFSRFIIMFVVVVSFLSLHGLVSLEET